MLYVGTSNAQYREVPVAPGIGTLNAAIIADSANRTTDTWYVLQKGTSTAPAIYVLSGVIDHNYILNIKAVGPGDRRPMLIPLAVSGGTSARPFRTRNNLTLVGLYVTGKNTLGAYGDNNIIRTSADNCRITLENCWLDYDGQSAIRLDNKLCKVYVKNSICSNIGQSISLDNGRFIDARSVLQDTIWVENTRVYNITSRVYRVGTGGGSIYQYWDHNTIINSGQHCMDIDEVGTAIFKNNLIINGAFFGQDSITTDPPRYLLEFTPIGALLTNQGITQQFITVQNNNTYLDPAIEALYLTTNNVDRRKSILFLDSLGQLAVDQAGVSSTIISENVGIIDGPQNPIALTTAFLDTTIEDSNYPPFENPNPTGYEFNLMYSQATASFTGDENNKPLGALTQWIDAGIVGLREDHSTNLPDNFELMNNFPNPFNPSTTIKFSISSESNIKLEVYNSIGQLVKELVNQKLNVGTYSIDFDASSFASGIYLYQLQADNFIVTKKMVLMK